MGLAVNHMEGRTRQRDHNPVILNFNVELAPPKSVGIISPCVILSAGFLSVVIVVVVLMFVVLMFVLVVVPVVHSERNHSNASRDQTP